MHLETVEHFVAIFLCTKTASKRCQIVSRDQTFLHLWKNQRVFARRTGQVSQLQNAAVSQLGVSSCVLIVQCFSTFFASRTTLCNKKNWGNTKQKFIITIMMFSSVLALLIHYN